MPLLNCIKLYCLFVPNICDIVSLIYAAIAFKSILCRMPERRHHPNITGYSTVLQNTISMVFAALCGYRPLVLPVRQTLPEAGSIKSSCATRALCPAVLISHDKPFRSVMRNFLPYCRHVRTMHNTGLLIIFSFLQSLLQRTSLPCFQIFSLIPSEHKSIFRDCRWRIPVSISVHM